MKVRIIAIMIITLAAVNLAGESHARATAENLAEVEKLFMEAKYESVVTEAGKLIDSGASGREELNYLKGLSLMQLNRFGEARQTLEYMVERYPKGKRAFDGYTAIGDSYFLEGKFNEAVAAYSNTLRNFPDHKNSPAVYYKLGSSYQKLGMNEKANEYFNMVRKSSPLSFESNMVPAASCSENTANVISSSSKETECADTGDYYYVQAGYFKTKANADKLKDKLNRRGYDSYIATLVKSNTSFYKVKVGHFNSKDEAEAMAKRMRKDGYITKVCR